MKGFLLKDVKIPMCVVLLNVWVLIVLSFDVLRGPLS